MVIITFFAILVCFERVAIIVILCFLGFYCFWQPLYLFDENNYDLFLKQDSSFYVRNATMTQKNRVIFECVNFPNHFLKHFDGKLVVATVKQAPFDESATWIIDYAGNHGRGSDVIEFVKILKNKGLFDVYPDLVACFGIITIDDLANKKKWHDGWWVVIDRFVKLVENHNLNTSQIGDLMKLMQNPEWLIKSKWCERRNATKGRRKRESFNIETKKATEIEECE